MTNTFFTSDYDGYPDIEDLPARITFPDPFRLSDWKGYIRALRLTLKDQDEFEQLDELRQFRAALAVGELTEVPADKQTAVDPDSNDLIMSFVKWINDVADVYILPMLIVEGEAQTIARRQMQAHHGPTFNTADFIHLLPGLAAYPGTVTFKALDKHAYRAWKKAQVVNDKKARSDVDNSEFVRFWRSALALVESWHVEGITLAEAKSNDGEGTPLVLVSWLLETCDIYLSRRLGLKVSAAR